MHGAVSVFGALLVTVSALYTIHLKVPAVMEVRPNLVDVGFWTGVFSGRMWEYLYYHYPVETFVVNLAFTLICLNTVLLVPKR